MSNWFDILYGAKESAPEATATQHSGAQPEARLPYKDEPDGPATEQSPKLDLLPAPPLPKMPGRWLLELQKAAFHLSREGSSQGKGPPVIAFSGMQRRGGTSTISLLIAHYLAVDAADARILYVSYCLDHNRGNINKTDTTLRIGHPLSDTLFRTTPKAFMKLSVQPAEAGVVVNSAKWFSDLIDLSKKHCHWVILDIPPFFSSPESYIVSQMCDSVVLVLKSGETRYPALNGLVADLEQVGIRVLGTILNFRQYPIPRWLLKYI